MDNVLTQKLFSNEPQSKTALNRNEANNAIISLNKYFRSPNTSEQCEAIVRLGPIVSSYPFPSIVNTAFHRLADIYSKCSNTIRIAILQVFDQWSEHFNKISMLDEFYRKIFAVSVTTDPVARAITLRVLGHISRIFPEKKNAHRFIHLSFDSTYKEEVIAAIFAANCFCEHSQTFCAGVCSRLIEIIQEISTPNGIKLKLLKVFEHMGHDPETALQVKNFCVQMLHNYSSKDFTLTLLNTITKLSMKCMLLVMDNLAVLCSISLQDTRKSVQLVCCKNLQLLAQNASHLWNKESISNVMKLAENTPHGLIRAEALFVVFKLAGVDFMDTLFDELNIFERCSTLAFHKDIRVCISACKVLIEVITRKYETDIHHVKDSVALQSLVDQTDSRVVPLFGIMFLDDESSEFIKSSIISLVQRLSQINQLFAHRLSDVISTAIMNIQTPCDKSETLYRALTAVQLSSSLDLSHLVPALVSQLESTDTLQYSFSLIHLLILIHYAPLNLPIKSSFRNEVLPVIIHVLNEIEHPDKFWFIYRIAKLGLTTSFHELSLPLLTLLSKLPTTDKYHVLFQSISTFSQAETLLMVACDSAETAHSMEIDEESFDGNFCSFDPSFLLNVIQLYCSGISSLQTCRSLPNGNFWERFLQLRTDLLSALHQILMACNQIRLMPRSTHSQPDRLVYLFNKCLENISSSLALLQECRYRSFSADSSTLNYLDVLELSYKLLASVILKIILKEEVNLDPVREKLLKTPKLKFLRQYTDLCNIVLTQLSENPNFIQDPVSHQQINFIKSFCFSLIVIPFFFPLYFFHHRSKMQIQLSYINLPEKPQDPISLSLETSLSFAVEGIISENQAVNQLQKIMGVTVKAHVCPEKNSQLSSNRSTSLSTQTVTKQAELLQDNFNVSYLLQFPQPGQYLLDISIHLVDGDGTTWLATNLDSKPPQWRVLYATEDSTQ